MALLWTFGFMLGSLFVLGHAGCPNIITRTEWGARPPSGQYTSLPVPVDTVVIHHGDTDNYCTTQDSCIPIVRAYQDYHMDTNGWIDIGFNFVVGEDGNTYEGRGWAKEGAHATGWNARSIGICFIGNFTGRLPNAAALNAAQNLIQYGIDRGSISSTHQVVGHRQVVPTDCPGDTLYAYIQSWPGWTPNPTSLDEEPIPFDAKDIIKKGP